MTEWWHRRAIYNEEQQAYVVQHQNGTEVVYRFESLEPEEGEDNGFMGKMWAFMTLDEPERFQKIIDGLRAAAIQRWIARRLKLKLMPIAQASSSRKFTR